MTGDAGAKFNRLILPRLEDGFRLARWLVGNATDAEDAMQEACLRAFLAMDTLVEHNVRAWFLTIVRNVCYSWLERRKPGIILSSEELKPEDRVVLDRGGLSAEPAPNSEELLIAKDRARLLSKAIDELPFAMKEIIVLREYHDLSYREIADISGVPIGTVMSRLARARQHLLVQLKGVDGES